jgi:hypothetical protein
MTCFLAEHAGKHALFAGTGHLLRAVLLSALIPRISRFFLWVVITLVL